MSNLGGCSCACLTLKSHCTYCQRWFQDVAVEEAIVVVVVVVVVVAVVDLLSSLLSLSMMSYII